MSRRAPRPISGALDALASRVAPATPLARAQEAWPRAAGPAIAAAATPTAEREGVLTITCEAAVWAQELDLMSEQLIAALNAELGAGIVRELRCRTG
ncbi:MAG TPA: DciA family protein [Solirubrobacteraceae bacterium]|nr:DciA family protein [Solirubrobacteraceae bacterium]